MLAPIRYLTWARRFYGQVSYDLARSGVPDEKARDLAALDPDRAAAADDYGAFARFRAAVGARYGVPASEVVPCLGASGGIWLSYAVTVSAGDEVLVEDPAYEPLVVVAEGLGARVRRFARRAESGFAIDVGAVLSALGPHTKVVALSNPHNPSAVHVGDDTLGALARALEARGVLLFVDEAYREIVVPGTTARRLGDNVIACSSLTKCYGLGWARAGFTLMPEARVPFAEEALAHACGALPPSAASFGELALAHLDALADARDRAQAGKRALVDAFAKKHERTLSWTAPPERAVFGFFQDARGVDLRPRIEEGIARENVIVAPGSFFGIPAAFRMSFTPKTETIVEGLARLERVLGLGASS